MKIPILIMMSCCLVVALCGRRTEIHSPLVGREVELRKSVILFPYVDPPSQLKEIQFTMIAQDSNHSSPTEPVLRKGDALRITSVARYWTDSRGEWIGVTGKVAGNSPHAGSTFVFCWSGGGHLDIAPWEAPDTPKDRPRDNATIQTIGK